MQEITRRSVLGSCVGAVAALLTGKLWASHEKSEVSITSDPPGPDFELCDPDLTRLSGVYASRIVAMMGRLRGVALAEGLAADEVTEMCCCCDEEMCCCCDEWTFLIFAPGHDEVEPSSRDLDVVFRICESEQFDGTEGGVNFELMVTTAGGQVLQQLCLHNYTPEVWVDRRDHEAVEARFREFEETIYEVTRDLRCGLGAYKKNDLLFKTLLAGDPRRVFDRVRVARADFV